MKGLDNLLDLSNEHADMDSGNKKFIKKPKKIVSTAIINKMETTKFLSVEL